MKAAIFEKAGLENLNAVVDAKQPTISDQKVLINVKDWLLYPATQNEYISSQANRHIF